MNTIPSLLIGALSLLGSSIFAAETLHSPDGKIEVTFQTENKNLSYAVQFNGAEIISTSSLGLKAKPDDTIEVLKTSRSSFDETWKPIWGNFSEIRNLYNEIQLKLGPIAEQTVIFRAV